MRRPTRDPYARPAIQTLERLHAELGGKILENKQLHENLAAQMRSVEAVRTGVGGCERHQSGQGCAGGPAGSVLASLRDHKGKGIQRTNEGAPARWRLKEAAKLRQPRPLSFTFKLPR
jgi:hypothetical protein